MIEHENKLRLQVLEYTMSQLQNWMKQEIINKETYNRIVNYEYQNMERVIDKQTYLKRYILA